MKIKNIQDFLDKIGTEKFIGKSFDSNFTSKLLDDFGVPEGTVEFVGCIQNEYNLWDEFMFLYRFPQSDSAKKLGDNLKNLGKLIGRLESVPYDFGIQEIDPARCDGYYVLFYGLRERIEVEN